MTDAPILDYPQLFGEWLLWSLFWLALVFAYRAVRSAYLAEASAAQQAAWTAHLPECGLCGAHRLLTETRITVLDDIHHKIRASYRVAVCHDCASAITSNEQEQAA